MRGPLLLDLVDVALVGGQLPGDVAEVVGREPEVAGLELGHDLLRERQGQVHLGDRFRRGVRRGGRGGGDGGGGRVSLQGGRLDELHSLVNFQLDLLHLLVQRGRGEVEGEPLEKVIFSEVVLYLIVRLYLFKFPFVTFSICLPSASSSSAS